MPDVRLRVEGLGHWHRSNAWLFQNLDLALHAGQALAVLGPNGRGKSSLLCVLAGLARPRIGRATRNGRVAFVPAALNIAFDYTAFDLVLMGRARHVGLLAQPGPDDEAAAVAALERLEITALAQQPFATLSSGERQMVLLARAIASEADILVMDEPMAALDLSHQLWVASWLERLVRADGLALIFSTHDPNQAWDLASHVLLLHAAPDHELGVASQMLTPERLGRLFNCKVHQIGYTDRGKDRCVFVASDVSETS